MVPGLSGIAPRLISHKCRDGAQVPLSSVMEDGSSNALWSLEKGDPSINVWCVSRVCFLFQLTPLN